MLGGGNLKTRKVISKLNSLCYKGLVNSKSTRYNNHKQLRFCNNTNPLVVDGYFAVNY